MTLRPASAALWLEIYEAQKRRREVWEAWAKVVGGMITGLVGLVGATIGLVAFLKSN